MRYPLQKYTYHLVFRHNIIFNRGRKAMQPIDLDIVQHGWKEEGSRKKLLSFSQFRDSIFSFIYLNSAHQEKCKYCYQNCCCGMSTRCRWSNSNFHHCSNLLNCMSSLENIKGRKRKDNIRYQGQNKIEKGSTRKGNNIIAFLHIK